MAIPKSPYETTLPESWLWTVAELEQTQARPHRHDLRPLVDLTCQIAATKYGQSYRAGTSLRQTLVISTAAQNGLEPDEPCITVDVERMECGNFGFCILYHESGEMSTEMKALINSYGTKDFEAIHTNLRRDLANYYYPCDFADAWRTLQPLMIRLWNDTHPNETSRDGESERTTPEGKKALSLKDRHEAKD